MIGVGRRQCRLYLIWFGGGGGLDLVEDGNRSCLEVAHGGDDKVDACLFFFKIISIYSGS